MGHVYVERGSDAGVVDAVFAVELGGGREGVVGSSRMTIEGSAFGDATIGSSESESSMGTETLDDVATGAGLGGTSGDSLPVGSGLLSGTTSGGISHVEIWVRMVLGWLVSARGGCCASDRGWSASLPGSAANSNRLRFCL